jgi:hypothetical protein
LVFPLGRDCGLWTKSIGWNCAVLGAFMGCQTMETIALDDDLRCSKRFLMAENVKRARKFVAQ